MRSKSLSRNAVTWYIKFRTPLQKYTWSFKSLVQTVHVHVTLEGRRSRVVDVVPEASEETFDEEVDKLYHSEERCSQ